VIVMAAQARKSPTTRRPSRNTGMNRRHAKLVQLLRDSHIQTIVVEHRGWVARFSAEHLQAAVAATGHRMW
jgi:predicted site-specific integrase-resolvase